MKPFPKTKCPEPLCIEGDGLVGREWITDFLYHAEEGGYYRNKEPKCPRCNGTQEIVCQERVLMAILKELRRANNSKSKSSKR